MEDNKYWLKGKGMKYAGKVSKYLTRALGTLLEKLDYIQVLPKPPPLRETEKDPRATALLRLDSELIDVPQARE